MNRFLKTVLSVILCAFLLFFATSCSLVEKVKDLLSQDTTKGREPVVVEVPEGYTGGSHFAFPRINEVYWFETVDEAIEAISRLEAHESTVYKSPLFNYSEEDYDIKVLIKFNRTYVEPLKEGQNPFDRKAQMVYVDWYLFDEYIPIDELVYMYAEEICKLHNLDIFVEGENCKIENTDLITIDFGAPEYGLDWPKDVAPPAMYVVHYQGETIFTADINKPDDVLPDDIATDMAKTATVIGNTDNPRGVPTYVSFYDYLEEYWFETYDELIDAIETLKSHGSTINPSYVFDCEGMLLNDTPLDCKYIITFEKKNSQPLQGSGVFDRKVEGVNVTWLAYDRFYPIFDASFTYYFDFDYILDSWEPKDIEINDINDSTLLDISYDLPGYGLDSEKPWMFAISYDGTHIMNVNFSKSATYPNYPPPEFALEFIKTFKFIK